MKTRPDHIRNGKTARPQERLAALQRLREMLFTIANQGKPLPDYETLRANFREFFKITKRRM